MDRKAANKLESREANVGSFEMVGVWLGKVRPEMGNKVKLYISEAELRDIGEWT